MIRNGNKLYELVVRGDKKTGLTHTVFRDSYNLAPFALGKFVKAFGLTVEEKRHFPHYYNNEENYGITLPHLPDLKYYSPDTKKADARNDLLKWYAENIFTPFNLCEMLAEYCMSDCEILAEGMLKLREEFLEISQVKLPPSKKKNLAKVDESRCSLSLEDDLEEESIGSTDMDDLSLSAQIEEEEEETVGLDILEKSRTIASAAMQIYRLKYLPKETSHSTNKQL
jgi:hypothetical protein